VTVFEQILTLRLHISFPFISCQKQCQLAFYFNVFALFIYLFVPLAVHLLVTDPQLCMAIYTGTFTTYQYRLVGPGAWSGARLAVLGVLERLTFPVNPKLAQKKQLESSKTMSFGYLKLLIATTVIFCAVLVAVTSFR